MRFDKAYDLVRDFLKRKGFSGLCKIGEVRRLFLEYSPEFIGRKLFRQVMKRLAREGVLRRFYVQERPETKKVCKYQMGGRKGIFPSRPWTPNLD